MERVGGGKKAVGVREEAARDEAKRRERCDVAGTGAGVVDLGITDRGVVTIDKKGSGGMTLTEVAPGTSLDEIKAKTEATYQVAGQPSGKDVHERVTADARKLPPTHRTPK